MARRLNSMERHGFRVLHDLQIPGSRANIDHLVIGPPGVFAVDTKNYSGRITRSKGTLWHGRYPMTRQIAATRWEAERATQALAGLLPAGQVVTPIMCVLGAELPQPQMRADDVTIVSGGRRLNRSLKSGRPVLTPATIAQLAAQAQTALRSSPTV
jgi:hypothetical protein